ncbi:hypothetical protein GCM10017788_20250 [Amycolatopsis acidiphila]|nr:hypothetical protein GCM10017788_20250 [Amycolatopsis acidiphila]
MVTAKVQATSQKPRPCGREPSTGVLARVTAVVVTEDPFCPRFHTSLSASRSITSNECFRMLLSLE